MAHTSYFLTTNNWVKPLRPHHSQQYQDNIITHCYSNDKNQYRQILMVMLVLVCAGIWQSAQANDFQECRQNFYAGTPPEYHNEKLTKNTMPLCFNGFATFYSGVTRTPMWSAEHLTRQRLEDAEEITRDDSFHEESRLPQSMRAHLSDYKKSGFDRGHLAPNADMATLAQQYDSFSLANIAPQAPKNNRYIWRNLETVTRYLTKQYGETYVVTGVAFEGKKIAQLQKNVLIPTHFFKAVYIPATGEAGVYYAPNDDTERVEVISIEQLSQRTGIDIMPAISPVAKAQATPFPHQVSDMTTDDTPATSDEPWWLQMVIQILKWLVDTIFNK